MKNFTCVGLRTGIAARFPILLALLALGVLAPLRAWAGCDKDTDCKGDRICRDGVCVDPGPPRAPAPPAGEQPSPPPGYPPPAQGYPPPPEGYAPPPGAYAPPPPGYAPPPPYVRPYPRPAPRRVLPPERGTRSYLAIGGVGELLAPPPAFGGFSGEAQVTFQFFNTGIADGGLTLNILDDVGFTNIPTGNPLYETIAGGLGFDIGLFKRLQFGPRVDFGYGADVTNTFPMDGAFWSAGGHVIFWFDRLIGLYIEGDALMPLSRFAPQGGRMAGGFTFAWH